MQRMLTRLRTDRSQEWLTARLRSRSIPLIWAVIRTFLLVGLCFMILYPLFLTISRAFMGEADLNDSTVVMLPKHLSLSMVKLAAGPDMLNYWPALLTTLLYTAVMTLLQTAACLLAGYGFGRYRLPFQRLLFAMVLFTILVPPHLYMPSLYLRMREFDLFGLFRLLTGEPLNLVGQYSSIALLSLTGNGIKNGLFIYIFRQNFKGMPKALEEAALVDGAGHFKIFTRIMLPNAVTTIVTAALISFVWQYNDTFYSGLMLGVDAQLLSLKYEALSVMNPEMLGTLGVDSNQIFNPVFSMVLRSAMALLVLLPVVSVYLLLQRFFVDGIERSGLVG